MTATSIDSSLLDVSAISETRGRDATHPFQSYQSFCPTASVYHTQHPNPPRRHPYPVPCPQNRSSCPPRNLIRGRWQRPSLAARVRPLIYLGLITRVRRQQDCSLADCEDVLLYSIVKGPCALHLDSGWMKLDGSLPDEQDSLRKYEEFKASRGVHFALVLICCATFET